VELDLDRMLKAGVAQMDDLGLGLEQDLAAGATSADCWTASESWGLALVRAGVEEEGSLSLALHVVPVAWVSESRAGKAVRGVDVRWSWADVTALYAGMGSLGSTGGEESQ